MNYLILGTTIFFLIHVLPSTSLKKMLSTNFGPAPYKISFSLISLLGLGLMIYGYSQSTFQPLWTPPSWGRVVLMLVMPIVCVLLVAAEAPNNIKRFVRHPMLIAMTIWGAAHLIGNGDLASTIIFASFAIFSIINIVMVNARGPYSSPEAVSPIWDVAVIALGLLVYGLLFYFHGTITGMPI